MRGTSKKSEHPVFDTIKKLIHKRSRHAPTKKNLSATVTILKNQNKSQDVEKNLAFKRMRCYSTALRVVPAQISMWNSLRQRSQIDREVDISSALPSEPNTSHPNQHYWSSLPTNTSAININHHPPSLSSAVKIQHRRLS